MPRRVASFDDLTLLLNSEVFSLRRLLLLPRAGKFNPFQKNVDAINDDSWYNARASFLAVSVGRRNGQFFKLTSRTFGRGVNDFNDWLEILTGAFGFLAALRECLGGRLESLTGRGIFLTGG